MIVVYGGTARQSRSDGEVVPFNDLYDVLERFEINEEMTAFVKDKIAPAPSESDVYILDSVYSKHIRPTLDELESSLTQQHVSLLFREVQPCSFIKFGSNNVNSSSLLEARKWEHTKGSYIVKRGFRLSARRPLEISHRIIFTGHIDPGDFDFSLVVSLTWHLDNKDLSQSVAIDGTPVQKLSDRILYSELGTRSAKVDRICSGILKAIMKEIESRSDHS